MNKFTSVLLIALFFLASCKSNEQKAGTLIRERLNLTLNDFTSYEPLETKIDSAFRSGLLDSSIVNRTKIFVEVMDDYERNSELARTALRHADVVGSLNYSAYAKAQWDKYQAQFKEYEWQCIWSGTTAKNLDKTIREMIDSLGNDFVGWSILHRFRAKNKDGNYEVYDYLFVADPGFKQLLLEMDTGTEESKQLMMLLNGYFKQDEIRFFDEDIALFVTNDLKYNRRPW